MSLRVPRLLAALTSLALSNLLHLYTHTQLLQCYQSNPHPLLLPRESAHLIFSHVGSHGQALSMLQRGIGCRKILKVRLVTSAHSSNIAKMYSDGKEIAYFRGRKLVGKQVALPEGYRGTILLQISQGEPSKQVRRSSTY